MEKKVAFVLILVSVVALYFPVFGTYFTGDDFFHFKASLTDGSFTSFLKFFSFPSFEERGYAFYRPIFRELLYFIFYNFFGLNQLPFRILQFMLHFGNIFLVYLLVNKLFGKKLISIFAAFFFGITSANVGSLYYLAGGVQAQGATFFMLATVLLFWSKKRVLSFLTFVLAISSHELAVTTPLLLAGVIFISEGSFKKAFERVIKELWLYFLVTVLFLYLNIFIIGLPEGEIQYSPSFNIKAIANTLSWYTLWALGLPEMLVDFVRPGLSLNPNLMKYWGNYFRVVFPSFFISLAVLSMITFYLILRDFRILKEKRFWFLVSWFVIVLLPVLFLPIHKKAYYLQPALPAFWGAVGYLANYTKEKLRLFYWILGLSLLVLSVASIKLGEKTYWAVSRGKIAQKLIKEVKSKFPTLPSGAKVYFKNDPNYPFIAKEWGGTSTQAFFVLSGSDALELVYKDPTLKVYYEDRGKPPKYEIFEITAEIPH